MDLSQYPNEGPPKLKELPAARSAAPVPAAPKAGGMAGGGKTQ
jgi:hypothetical protein